MVLVSVIIPYFKKKKFIEKTVQSVKSQTHTNLEIIIVYDDEDHSDLNLIRKIIKSDKRIKLILNKNSLGAGKSRNVGMGKAKGKYLAFLDADDFWKKDKVKSQLKFMEENDFDISHTSYEVLKKNNNDKKILIAKTFKKPEQLLPSCDIGLSTVMLKKSLISKNFQFPGLKTKEDFVLWLKILQKNISIGSLNETLTSWRKLDNSLSSSVIQKIKDAFKVYNYYMKFQ